MENQILLFIMFMSSVLRCCDNVWGRCRTKFSCSSCLSTVFIAFDDDGAGGEPDSAPHHVHHWCAGGEPNSTLHHVHEQCSWMLVVMSGAGGEPDSVLRVHEQGL